MSGWLIALTGLVYLYVSLEQLHKGNTGMFIAYLGYAFSNVGLYMLASKQEVEMKEPQRYSMSTGLPVKPEVKKYPLGSAEKSFWEFIAKHEESRANWERQKTEQVDKQSDQTQF